jgi:hypothetical protein
VCKCVLPPGDNSIAVNKRFGCYFEEKNGECAACLKYSVLVFVEKNI